MNNTGTIAVQQQSVKTILISLIDSVALLGGQNILSKVQSFGCCMGFLNKEVREILRL
jgi:hypothetical protein